MKSVAQKILVSNPNLRSGIFERTLIYVVDHTAQGASGFIVNLPMPNITLDDVGHMAGIEWNSPRSLYVGGPIQRNALYVLHSNEWHGTSTQKDIGNGLCVSSDPTVFERLAQGDQPAYWKVVSGVCGWAPGQLDDELEGVATYSKGAGWLTMNYADRWIFNAEEQDRVWHKAIAAATQQAVQSFF